MLFPRSSRVRLGIQENFAAKSISAERTRRVVSILIIISHSVSILLLIVADNIFSRQAEVDDAPEKAQ
jgi:competence protein ComGC